MLYFKLEQSGSRLNKLPNAAILNLSVVDGLHLQFLSHPKHNHVSSGLGVYDSPLEVWRTISCLDSQEEILL